MATHLNIENEMLPVTLASDQFWNDTGLDSHVNKNKKGLV